MDDDVRAKIIDKILSKFAEKDSGFDLSSAIKFAKKEGDLDIESFLNEIKNIYNPNVSTECLKIDSDYFDVLFILDEISRRVKKLAGSNNGIFFIFGLDKSSLDGTKNWSQRKRQKYFDNIESIENFVLSYKEELNNIDIIFL